MKYKLTNEDIGVILGMKSRWDRLSNQAIECTKYTETQNKEANHCLHSDLGYISKVIGPSIILRSIAEHAERSVSDE